MIPIIAAYIVMLANAAVATWTNLRILKAQLLAMAQYNINPLSTPAYVKYVMFQRLAMATGAYVVMELLIHITLSVVRTEVYVFLLCHQLMELSVACYIGIQFRARPLSYVFQNLQQFGIDLVRAAAERPCRAGVARGGRMAHALRREAVWVWCLVVVAAVRLV
jgi:hypothetical protein